MGSRHLIAFRDRSAATVQALAAATGRLAEALRELEQAREAAGAGLEVDAALERTVRQRLAEVIAHREALGIAEHAVLYEVLRVPRDLRAPPARPASDVA